MIVIICYSVGAVLSKYRSGKLPKPFKIIPSLSNWEEILYCTDPDSWTPAAMYQATRLFVSNLNAKMAQRYNVLSLFWKSMNIQYTEPSLLSIVWSWTDKSDHCINVFISLVFSFFNLVLLPRVRDDIAEYKRLNYHLYMVSLCFVLCKFSLQVSMVFSFWNCFQYLAIGVFCC